MTPAEEIEIGTSESGDVSTSEPEPGSAGLGSIVAQAVEGASGWQTNTFPSQISPDDFAAAATVLAAEPSG